MATDRLRWLEFFHGKVVDASDWEEFDAALHHWERQVYKGMYRDGTVINHFPALTGVVGALAYTVGAWQGASDGFPLYQNVNVQVSLITADSGTLLGSTVVAGGGLAKWIVVTAEYVDIEYDQYTDSDGVVGNYREDHGIRYRVFMGAEAAPAVAALPLVDLATYYTNYKSIPIFAYQRQFGELDADTPDDDYLKPMQSYWVGSYLSKTIKESAACLLSMGVAQARRISTTGLYIDEDTARLPSFTTAAAVNGGTVSISGSHAFLFSGGRLRIFDASLNSWTSPDLDVSSDYFLRCRINDYQSMELYLQKGSMPAASGATYTYPATLVGDPYAAVGGAFPSTELDCLLGRVVTGLAGAIPTFTAFRQGDFSHSEIIAPAADPALHTINVVLPTPHACDMEVIIQDPITLTPAAPAGCVTHIITHKYIEFYNFLGAQVKGDGQWLEQNGVTGDLKIPAAVNGTFRPGMLVMFRSKGRSTP